MSALFDILDGIFNSDYAEQTLSDSESVIAYAEAAGHEISFSDADKIMIAGKRWLESVENGNGEWSRMREEAREALDEA